jgi:hypothetical protein
MAHTLAGSGQTTDCKDQKASKGHLGANNEIACAESDTVLPAPLQDIIQS